MSTIALNPSAPSPQPYVLGRLGRFLLLLALGSFVVDAPLRYVLSIIHLEKLLYLRDLFAVYISACAIALWIIGRRSTPVAMVLLVFLIHVFWGMLILPSIFQPLVGLKIFFSFLLGITCFETYRQNEKEFFKWIVAAYVITAIGVALNWAVEMPWSGQSFSSAVGDVDVSKEWTSGGIRRLAGFARASYDASTILAISCSPLLLHPKINAWFKTLLYFITLALMVGTTSKGSVLAWLLMGMALPMLREGSRRQTIISFMMIMPVTLILIPVLIYVYQYKAVINGDLWWLLSSFADRINRMWPEAMTNLSQHGSAILGRGVGGIGFPQLFGDGLRYNSADNVMVYLYSCFGIMSLVYIYTVLISLWRNSGALTHLAWGSMMMWLSYWFIYGLTANDIETPFMQFFSGITVGAAISLMKKSQ